MDSIEPPAPGDPPVAERFERAVRAIIDGDLAVLEEMLRAHPELVRARSRSAHRSTLLHYVSANGVEDHLQRTPPNAASVARALLAAGAEADATSDAYGGGSTTLALTVTSVHPYRAGVQGDIVEALLDGGAAAEGPKGDGAPLRLALHAHFLGAARTLVRRGASVKDLVTAAGLGREADVVARLGSPPRERGAALILAAAHGHSHVVARLLGADADPAALDERGFTAMHWAAHHGHAEVVRQLIAAGAPLEARNPYDGTPLDQTLWASIHAGLAPDEAAAVAKLLLDSAARLDAGWRRPLEEGRFPPELRALLTAHLPPATEGPGL